MQQIEERFSYTKPRGIWVSCDGEDDWPAWCKSENFIDTNKQLHYRINLKKGANILFLNNSLEIDAFTERYGTKERYHFIMDWPGIAKDYDGLVIPTYIWERRMHESASWYYGWDCASGCIWNSDAIDGIELLNGDRKAA